MKQKLFRLVIMLSLLAALVGSSQALAQGPLPPTPIPHPRGPQDFPDDVDPLTGRHIPPRFMDQDGLAPGLPAAEMALGTSGLSFRYVQTFGVSEEAYPADAAHLNRPYGLFVDGSDNLYVTEEYGHRVLAYDSTGSNILTMGHAGVSYAFDDYLGWARGVVVRPSDGHIWVIINPALKEFDGSGNLVQTFPAVNPWETGTDNGHFAGEPRGLAMDSSERLYVADTNNHRIQVFDLSGGAPSYLETIGTGSPVSDETGFNWPVALAFDSLDRLYVMDSANFRVQRCTNSGVWTCATFFGETGVWGSGLDHLSQWTFGITIDNSDNIFIVDSGNQRVLKCNTSPSCSLFAGETGVTGSDNSHFSAPIGVAVDSTGSVYVSDDDNFRVQKFNSAGAYQSTIGVTGVPYFPDTIRLNDPWGIAVAPDGSIFVVENKGHRLVKMNAAGTQQWTVGKAGVWGTTNNRLGNWWGGLEGNPALDSAGRIYVPDTGNDRVQIFNPNGTFFARMTGFSCPEGVAISPVNGDIFVTDMCNHRIQVFSSSRVYKATLGTTGVEGSDNKHFRSPRGVAIDSAGKIYVADSENHRVQKCTLSGSSYTCSTFAGETGVFGQDFGHLHPLSVAVDKSGRVYAADEWNNRVQVFNPAGAYLTTIGGNWGSGPSDFVNASGVAVDKSGNVYVTDFGSHRIQKFAPGVPGWTQSNLNGFGDRFEGAIMALTPYNGQLYAGTDGGSGSGGQLWRTSDGKSWSPVVTDGFGSIGNFFDHLAAFNGSLYASTGNCGNPGCTVNPGGQIWRSSTGDAGTWSQVVPDGFGSPVNVEIYRLQVFKDQLYASTWSWDNTVHGGEIWRSDTGDLNDWEQVVSDGFDGDKKNWGAGSFEILNGMLYAGTVNDVTGGEVWRSASGDDGTWTQVNVDGFGEAANMGVSALAVYNGYLYASTRRSDSNGAQIWRCQACNGGDWQLVVPDGLGDPETRGISGLEVTNGQLYFVVRNYTSGMQVWGTADGINWTQVGFDGLGDKNNLGPYWDNSVTVFNNRLYVGTINYANGGEVWQRIPTSKTVKVYSAAANDGWVLESTETSGKGGTMNAGALTFSLGDNAQDKQYRAILSFNTGALPDNAAITRVQVKIMQQGLAGTNPFTTHGGLKVDIKKGAFSNAAVLQLADFNATADKTNIGTFGKTPTGLWYTATLTSAAYPFINKAGNTQLRLRFNLDDNDDLAADYMLFHSGNAIAANRPVLIITYSLP